MDLCSTSYVRSKYHGLHSTLTENLGSLTDGVEKTLTCGIDQNFVNGLFLRLLSPSKHVIYEPLTTHPHVDQALGYPNLCPRPSVRSYLTTDRETVGLTLKEKVYQLLFRVFDVVITGNTTR